mgnify:FL=1
MTELQTALQGASTITGSNGYYRMEWPDLRVKAHITRVKSNKNNEIHGEIDISSERPTSAGPLKGGKLNITSVKSRHEWALSLARRDSEVDWDALLEQLYIKVKKQQREGAPVEHVTGKADLTDGGGAPWVIEPLLQLNNISMVYGDGSSGKSMLALFVALVSSMGINRGGFRVTPQKVLYLDWETDFLEINVRITKMLNALGVSERPDSVFEYRGMEDSLENDHERIKEIINDEGITLLIIDSVDAALSSGAIDDQSVTGFFNAIKKFKVTTLLIHHTNAQGGLYGSRFFYHRVRLLFEAKSKQESNSKVIHQGLFHLKANNAMLYPDMGFEIVFGDGTITIERKDIRDTPLDIHMSLPDRVANTIRLNQRTHPHGMSAVEIAEDLKAGGDERPEDKIRTHVGVLFHNDKNSARPRFVQLSDRGGNNKGKWGLAASPDQAEEEKIWQHQAALKETVKEIVQSEGGIQSLRF